VLESHASYRPVGHASFREAVDLASQVIAFCHDHAIRRLLLDSTGLTGLGSPTDSDRYYMAERFAPAAMGVVKVVIVARQDFIDPERFGMLVARNRGLRGNVFATEVEALEWLLNSETD
jgi:hypothetical protein